MSASSRAHGTSLLSLWDALGGRLADSIDETQDLQRAPELRAEAEKLEAEEIKTIPEPISMAVHARMKTRADAQGYAAAAQHALLEALGARAQAQKAAASVRMAEESMAEVHMRKRSLIDTFLGSGMSDYDAARQAALSNYTSEALRKKAPVAPLYFQGDVTTATTL